VRAEGAGDLVVIGAGGHGAVVAEAAASAGWNVIGFLDDRATEEVLGLAVLGPVAAAGGLAVAHAALGIGDNDDRLGQLRRLSRDAALLFPPIVHGFAWVSPSAQLRSGAVVMAGAIVQARAVIGEAACVNTRASVDHDCVLESSAHVAPGASLAGNVRVGECATVGAGAAIVPGIRIGAGSTLGTGAVATRDVPPHCVAAGVPAKVIRNRQPFA
jgi:sugar O-acyltransferase (sialic acid O-acetyltransferase NeuD family)